MAPSRGFLLQGWDMSRYLRSKQRFNTLIGTSRSGVSCRARISSSGVSTSTVQSITQQLEWAGSYFDSKQFLGPVEVRTIEGKRLVVYSM